MGNHEWIAACGLDCESCEIRRLPFDEVAAEACVKWYREMGWLTSKEGVALQRVQGRPVRALVGIR